MKIGSNRIQLELGSVNALRTPQQFNPAPSQQDSTKVTSPKSRRIVVEDSLSPSLKSIIKGTKSKVEEEEEEDDKPLTTIERTIKNLKKQIKKTKEEIEQLKNDTSASGEKKREMLAEKLNTLHSALSEATESKAEQDKKASRQAQKAQQAYSATS